MQDNIASSRTDSPLLVIDHLQVGPVTIEPTRLLMPYTVTQDGKQESKELIYKYDEEVFDPQSPASQNLSSLIGAQLALNYGLFCKKITFDGLFDENDQKLLRDMLENTSREILVNKIYPPNVFLQGLQVPVEKRKSYTLAEVVFINSHFSDSALTWSYWAVDRNKHCVLSSGGKDSLLSYGLLKELGKEVHPIFGNESGRHWFTALNAHRYLKEQDANTAKVWMNSDRLFAWMLRQLPFVRADFAQVRADDYPIRLWTVAVFSFGVLPLLKKRGIGRLVIGDEYDATQRGNFKGIAHYNGLYDQSRYFDEAFSRFFMKKGWGISQFSLLRSLSELLIMKVLVKRYPELQEQQVSCHAAHEKEGRIYPCGKCEKCRRIVGMLTALEADPSPCGYKEEQIAHAHKSLQTQKVKQIGTDASHLFYLLGEKKVVSPGARPHPVIMQLRFDQERSHIDGIPLDLRWPLYRILLQYAEGAVQRVQRSWQDIELLKMPQMQAAYSFEPIHMTAPTQSKKNYLWAELTWEEAQQRTQETDTVLLPVGAIEQHGPHLSLDIDAFDADYLAKKVAEACSDPKPLVLPLVPYGVSYHHNDFAGTISISNEAMARFIYDIGVSLSRNGIKKLVIINGHGDNAPTLNYAAQMINRDTGLFVCVDTGESSDLDIEQLVSTRGDVHAGEIETSTSLAIRPHLVKMEKATKDSVEFQSKYLDFGSANHIPWYVRTKKISENGTLGDPTQATAEKGQAIWEIMIGHLVAFVEEIKGLSLEEIHQKRY